MPTTGLVHAALRLVPDGAMLPILSGPLRGWWFTLQRPHFGYVTGGYEPAISRTIARLLQPGQCFYDLGAHLGYHTLIGAKCVGPSGLVVAFEPRPENRLTLLRNVGANHVWNRHMLWGFAVADRDGMETWQQVEGQTMHGKLDATDKHPEWHDLPFTTTQVHTRSLDSFLEETGWSWPPDLMKIDVEGAESRVLRGAERTLREHGPTLILSVHGMRQTLASLELLGAFGYGVSPIYGDDVLLAQPHDGSR